MSAFCAATPLLPIDSVRTYNRQKTANFSFWLYHSFNNISTSSKLSKSRIASIGTLPPQSCSQSYQINVRIISSGVSALVKKFSSLTFNASDVETVATKVILLRAGKIVDAAPVPELIEKYAPGQGLEDVYLNVFGEGDGK